LKKSIIPSKVQTLNFKVTGGNTKKRYGGLLEFTKKYSKADFVTRVELNLFASLKRKF